MATPPMPPAGWYADPSGRHEFRYWAGTYWTAGVADGGIAAADLPQGPPPPAQQATAGFSPAQQATAGFSPAQGPATSAAPPLPGEISPVSPLLAGLTPATAGVPPATGRQGRNWVVAAGRTQLRHGRNWVLPAAIVTVVVLGLVTGLVIWAPWKSPPLLRPTGLAAGTSTISSVAFHWSDPRTGPLPDKYLILSNGAVVGSVPGTVTSYRSTGLAPDTFYQYRVVAERGGQRSARSALLVVRTAIPPVSAARWTGPWTVDAKITRGQSTIHGAKRWTATWLADPRCATGPCAVRLSVAMNGHSFKVTMARAGAVYRGRAQAHVFPCGTGANSFPIRSTLTIRIVLTSAQVTNEAWLASAWRGTMVVVSPYTSSGNYYCPAARQTITLAGSP
jgi:hypothetical protein